jgi:cellulose synthase/poly-beta-1,6-N-acetylglucosamine synthase-like glycosyltransferase
MATAMHWLDFVFLVIAALLLVPIGVVCIQCLAWLLPKPRKISVQAISERAPLVVLIPAHNEEVCIAETLRSVKGQLREGDGILVVADNCEDRTAAIARDAGAEVIERFDVDHRGKGYALSFGVDHLKGLERAPKVAIIIDADCTAGAGAIEALAAQTIATGRPVQAIYLLDQPAGESTSQNIFSGMAFQIRNGVRPGGSSRLGLPCLLTGSGMAFPWEILRVAKLGSDNLVEDMQLGVDLAIAGWPASLCEEARIFGRLPLDTHAAKTQRTRWEHGQIATSLSQVPRLVWAGIRTAKIAPLALAMDLSVPPLSLLALLIMGTILASSALVLFAGGSWRATDILLGGTILLFVCLAIGSTRFGRVTMTPASLLKLPTYILWKLPIYVGFIWHRQTEWIRTSRSAVPSANSEEVGPTAAGPNAMPKERNPATASRKSERIAG